MNCLEFRRHVGAEPSSALAAVAAHRDMADRRAQAGR